MLLELWPYPYLVMIMNDFARPRKALGQNFLEDHNVIRKIVASLHLCDDDIVLEIGPGRGALTEHLLQRSSQLHIVEFDRDLIKYWQSRSAGNELGTEKLVVHGSDILDFDLDHILSSTDKQIKVIGNLPYNISSPVLFHLSAYADSIERQVVMLQKEVVDRLVSEPGSKTYGRLSVMIQQKYQVERQFNVSPQSFNPAPKVDSAVVALTPLRGAPQMSVNDTDFSKLVKQAFSMRRKTLRNNLKGLLSSEVITELGIDPSVRAETLSVEQFVVLTNRYTLLTENA